MSALKSLLSESIAVLASTTRRVRRGAWPMFVALTIAEAVTTVALAPLGATAVNWLIRRSGYYAIANEDLVGFVLSPIGAATLFVSATVGLTVFALGRAAALLALQGAVSGQRASGVIAFAHALKRLPRITELAARQACVLTLIGAPFAAVVGLIAWFTLRGADMYWVVTVRPVRFWIGASFAAPVAFWGAWLVGRRALTWSIALPLCVLHGRSARVALRESASLLRTRLRVVAAVRLSWLGVATVFGVGAVALVHAGAEFILRRDLGGVTLTTAAAGFVLLAYAVTGFVVSMVASLGDVAAVHAIWARQTPADDAAVATINVSRVYRGAKRTRMALLGCLCVAAAFAGVLAYRLLATARAPIEIEVTAHRGAARLAPENTLASIRAAVALGVDRVEFDVMQSVDGALILFHDTDLRRIARDSRRVASMTLSELREVDAGSWFAPEFAGEPIPTLDEALEAARGSVKVNAELKSVGDEEELARLVAAAFRAHTGGAADGSIISSLSTRTLAAMRREDPTARLGLIVTASMGDLRRVDVDLLVVESSIATGRFLRRARRAGLPVYVWGVSNPDLFAQLAFQGVEGVITPDPEALLARRAELEQLTEVERLALAFRLRIIGE